MNTCFRMFFVTAVVMRISDLHNFLSNGNLDLVLLLGQVELLMRVAVHPQRCTCLLLFDLMEFLANVVRCDSCLGSMDIILAPSHNHLLIKVSTNGFSLF